MVKLNKIYTRTGDDGTTGLVDGSRLPKHSARLEAVGAVDEANAALGFAAMELSGDALAEVTRLQNDMFDLGADPSVQLLERGNVRCGVGGVGLRPLGVGLAQPITNVLYIVGRQ